MSVYKRTYKPYEGPLAGRGARFEALMRYAFADVWGSRVTVVLFVLCLVPSLISLASLYVLDNEAVRALLTAGTPKPIAVDSRFFLIVQHTQCWCALALTAWVGPRLIAIDLTNGALPIILSHPISRLEYVLAKLSVLAGFLSAITWVPALLLFVFQSYASTQPWAASNLHIAWAVFFGSIVWIVLLSLIALAVSAWVKWRIVATGMVFAAVFVPAGMAGVFNAVMRTDWGNLVNIPFMMATLWRRMMHLPSASSFYVTHEIPTSAMLAALALICVGCVWALNLRVRAREVVRG